MHHIQYYTYTERKSKEAIESELNREARNNGGKGLISSIRFIDKVFPNYSSACDFIQQNDKGWYDCLAVKFKQVPEGKSTKKLAELKEKASAAWLEYDKANRYVVAKDLKAAFIGCKECNSKLNKKHIKSNICPLCGTDMRSETTLNKLATMKAKVEKLHNAIAEEEKKLADKNGQICWVVKIEYRI